MEEWRTNAASGPRLAASSMTNRLYSSLDERRGSGHSQLHSQASLPAYFLAGRGVGVTPTCCPPTPLSLPVILALRDGHAVDLDLERTGPLRDAEEDSGRRVLGEVAFVDLVEGLEALGGYAEHVALQHVIEVRPRRLQHCLHLFEDALCLALERRMLQELAGVRVEGRQAGHEHHVPSSGADRDGSAPFLKIGVERFDADDLSFHGPPPLRLDNSFATILRNYSLRSAAKNGGS